MLTGQSLIKRDLRMFKNDGIDGVRRLLRSADCGFTNYEGTIQGIYGGWPMKDRYIHAADPSVLDALKDSGINLLALSNNHAFDLGPSGILSTLEECSVRGLVTAGAGPDLDAAVQPGVLQTKEGSIALVSMNASDHGNLMYARNSSHLLPARPGINAQRVWRGIRVPRDIYERMIGISSSLGNELRKAERLRMGFPQAAAESGMDFYGAWVESGDTAEEIYQLDPIDLERNLSAIRDAASDNKAVIAYVHQHHWSPRWQDTPEWLRNLGRKCIDAGATLFVSHGVPMLLGVEFYKGRPLCFGLGNFIFHTYRVQNYIDEASWESVIVECDLKPDRIEVVAHPIMLRAPDREYPELASGAHRKRILSSLDALSRPLGACVDTKSGRVTATA